MVVEKRNRKVMQIENINAIFPHYCSFFIKLIQNFNHLSIQNASKIGFINYTNKP